MGNFLDEKAIINKNIEAYNNYINSKGRFMEGNPTFVTYYRQNRDISTEDIGLGATVEIIGSESPIRFDKIENLPLYQFEKLELAYEFDLDTSLDTSEINGSAIIPPNTIKPNVDDYFTVSYLNRELLFRVNNISSNNIGKKFFYKIEYTLSRANIRILEERQIHEILSVNYDNVGGSKNSPIIENSLYNRLTEIEEWIYKLNEYYDEYYFNSKLNAYFYNNIYDNQLHIMFSRNRNMHILKKSFMTNKFIIPLLGEDIIDKKLYRYSFYNYIENILNSNKEDISDYIENNVTCNYSTQELSTSSYTNIFGRTYRTYQEVVWSNSINEQTFIIDIVNDIKLNNTESENILSRILIELIDSETTLVTKCDRIVEEVNLLYKHIDYSLEEYIYLPCVILILIELSNKILKDTDNLLYERSGIKKGEF